MRDGHESQLCRSCAAPLTTVFADLGLLPISNAFPPSEGALAGEKFYPLRVFVCSTCWLVQIEDIATPPDTHFHVDYPYFSSYSSSCIDHARQYVEMAVTRFSLGPGSRVIEIASNDGYLLRHFVSRDGIASLGVDPAAKCALAASSHGIDTRVAFFGKILAADLAKQGWRERQYEMTSNEGFMAASKAWLRCGWDAKYVYGFSWLGRPIIQLPEDLIRIQEIIYRIKPDVIIETGIAHGGSLIFYASLCKAMGKGKVVGIDIDIRGHNRQAIEQHELSSFISLVEGNSVDPVIVKQVEGLIGQVSNALVVLDSNHSKDHVLAELNMYAPFVGPASYMVVADGIMAELGGAPRTKSDWGWNNPLGAIESFLQARPDFMVEEPPFPFNEGAVTGRVTYWPRAYLRRKS